MSKTDLAARPTALLAAVTNLIDLNRKLADEEPLTGARRFWPLAMERHARKRTWGDELAWRKLTARRRGPKFGLTWEEVERPVYTEPSERVLAALNETQKVIGSLPDSAEARALRAVFGQVLRQEAFKVRTARDYAAERLNRSRQGEAALHLETSYASIDCRLLDHLLKAAEHVDKGAGKSDDLLSSAVAVQRFNVSRSTLRRKVAAGTLQNWGSSAAHRYSESDLKALFPKKT